MIRRKNADFSAFRIFVVILSSWSACDSSSGTAREGGSASDGGVGAARLCNGSAELRLAVMISPGRTGAEQTLFTDIGGLIAVTGECKFWSQDYGRAERLPALRTGTLSREDENRIAKDLLFSRLPELGKNWPQTSGIFDADDTFVSDGRNMLTCTGFCNSPTNPKEVQKIPEMHIKWMEELVMKGSPVVEQRLRATILDLRGGALSRSFREVPEWPLNWDPATKSVREGVDPGYSSPGYSLLIDKPEEIKALRYFGVANGGTPLSFGVQVDFRRKGEDSFISSFAIVMRDMVPFEDERGLIDLHWRK